MDCGDVNTPATLDCFFKVVFPTFFHAAITFAGIAVVIMIIVAGMRFIASRGDSKQLEGARKTITYAIIGAAVIIFSVFIINIIAYFTGVSCIRFFGYDNCSQ